MRILHLSDLHIGKKINDISLLTDQEQVLQQALSIVSEKNIDLVIIAGDIFDTSITSSDSLRLFGNFTSKLIFEKKVKVIVISGNHDSGARIEYESEMKENVGYYSYGEYKKDLKPLILEDEFGKINFYPIPYTTPLKVRRIFDDEEIKTYDDAYKRIIENLNVDPNKRNVCIAHCFVTDLSIDDSNKLKEQIDTRDKYQLDRMVAGLEAVQSKHFDNFLYTALGHIHRSYPVKEGIVYCGSLLKTNFQEEKQTKYFVIVDIKEEKIELEKIKVDIPRDMEVITGNLEDILDDDYETNSFLKVNLLDLDPIVNAMDKLRQKFPNILQLSYENEYKNSYESSINLETMNFKDVINEFFKEKTGRDLEKKHKQVIDNILERMDENDENS